MRDTVFVVDENKVIHAHGDCIEAKGKRRLTSVYGDKTRCTYCMMTVICDWE